MSRTYTKKEIASLLKTSVRTIEDDCESLDIRPTKGDRNINLYSSSDFELIKQLREHCSHNRSRDSFAYKVATEIVEDKPQVVKLVQPEKLSIVKRDFKQNINLGLEQDPLYDLDILQRIADNNWLLPSIRLAPIFNISSSYLSSLSKYEYCGFVATKEIVSGRCALWKITANNS